MEWDLVFFTNSLLLGVGLAMAVRLRHTPSGEMVVETVQSSGRRVKLSRHHATRRCGSRRNAAASAAGISRCRNDR